MIYGCDTSHWNDDRTFKNLLQTDYFMFLKATEGTTYTDPKFKKRVMEALEYDNLGLGFYHFARPDNNPIAKREAENFLKAVEEFGDKCVYVLDWEGAAEAHDPGWIRKWCSFVEQKTGRKPMLYLNHSYASKVDTDLSDYPLWVAKWGDEPTGKIGLWDKYTVWQYTNTPYDKNVFHGTVEEFIAIGKSDYNEERGHYCGCCCCKR